MLTRLMCTRLKQYNKYNAKMSISNNIFSGCKKILFYKRFRLFDVVFKKNELNYTVEKIRKTRIVTDKLKELM